MKHLGKWIGLMLATVAALFCCVMTVFADEDQQPSVILKESGVENQYILRLDRFSSKFESVQFSIAIDGQVNAPEVVWMDNSTAHFQVIDTDQAEGKTVLTIYIDHLHSPIANSNSAELAELTFFQAVPSNRFSLEGDLIALDKNQERTVYSNPSFRVIASQQGSTSGNSGSSGNALINTSVNHSGSDSGSPASSAGVLGWEDVARLLSRKVLNISVEAGQVIGRNIFSKAAEKKAQIVLDYGDYVWTLDTSKGVSVASNRVYYDFSIAKTSYRNLSAAVDGSDVAQFEISYKGALPCDANLSYQVGKKYAGQTLYLSYYNESNATLEFRGSAEVDSDGMVTFPISRAAKYVISSKNLWETAQEDVTNLSTTGTGTAGTTGTTGTANGSGSEIPNTGVVVTVPPEDEVEDFVSSDALLSDEKAEDVGTEGTEAMTVVSSDVTDTQIRTPSHSRTTSILVLVLIVLVAGTVAAAGWFFAKRRR